MSLVQHVTAAEGVDREPEEPDTESFALGRRLSLTISYDPIPSTVQPFEELEPIGAHEVSQKKRITQVAAGVVSCVLASGTVLGFAALKSVFVEEEVYRDSCTEEELLDNVRLCYIQDLRLNLTFNIASVTTNVSALVVGTILDRYGPRICGFISSGLLFLGSLCMAFAANLPFDAYVAGNFLLALGGTFVFVPSFHLSNAFPQIQGLILALITGAFDASAAVFLVFRLLYESSDGTFGLKQFFLAYLLVPVFIFVVELMLMPVKSYETWIELDNKVEEAKNPANDVHDSDEELETERDVQRVRSERYGERKRRMAEIRDLLGTQAERDEHLMREDKKHMNSGVWGALHGVPALAQVRTPWFSLITLLTVLQMARMNFFISTIWTQYKYMLGSQSKASQVNEFFDIALPIGGIAAVPFIGFLLDTTSTAVVLGLLVFLSTAIGILGVSPYLWAAYVNVILFVLFRPLYYSAMSDYAAKVFGFATFGTVYGTIICLSGLCTFAQSALQAITHDTFHDNPTPVNLALAGLGLLIGVFLVIFVTVRGRAMREEQADEDERRTLLPRPSAAGLRSLSTVQEAPEQ